VLTAAGADLQRGQRRAALDRLQALESAASGDAALLQQIAQFYTVCLRHGEALRLLQRAALLAPRNAVLLYNLSAALMATGDLEGAERRLDEAIALDPGDYDAYYNRATLRRQTPTRNHVAQLERLLAGPLRDPAGEVPLCYALAKELEDLGEHARSFTVLQRGAAARRRRLSYQVAADVATMEALSNAFDRDAAVAARPGESGPGPIFILGLPRSGTTLVDRILSCHSAVTSLGEINDLALTMVRLLPAGGDRQALIRAAARMDFRALGDGYLASVTQYGVPTSCFIDKTPLNFLYIGLIAQSLPQARIVHVRRQPLDVCYAMYKTLFRMGYPFSYDLGDLGAYYRAYHALMAHWHRTYPGRILDVDYEALVSAPETEARRLVAHCGLSWESACLDFHTNAAPAATASAAQVREPIYRSSVGAWQRHAAAFAPLEAELRAAGVFS
jgi:tetratricopeptide (TPR) repeat protein